jgi:hypothetical protein
MSRSMRGFYERVSRGTPLCRVRALAILLPRFAIGENVSRPDVGVPRLALAILLPRFALPGIRRADGIVLPSVTCQ